MQNDDDTSRGFGFVNFENPDSAQAAVSALNGKETEDKELYVGRAQKKSEREAALKQRQVLCVQLEWCKLCCGLPQYSLHPAINTFVCLFFELIICKDSDDGMPHGFSKH